MTDTTTDTVRRTLLALGAMAFLTAGAAAPAQAQVLLEDSPNWTVDGRGGIAVPVGDLSDLPIESVGPTFGVGVGYYVHPRVAVRVDGDVELYSGDDMAGGGTGPDVNLWHYNAGLELELTRPDAGPWDLTANLGGGATTWDTDPFTTGAGTDDLSETYFTANGGLKLGYDVSSSANVFVGGQWYLQFTDEDDTRALASLTPELNQGFDTASSFPLYAGLKLKL